MAKRFIDTGLFDDSWFMDLSKDGKLFWIYILTKCDHAGIIKINEKLCKFQTGIKDIETVSKELGNRLISVSEHFIFIPKFFKYQYPNFPEKRFRAAESAFVRLQEFGIDEEKLNSYLTLKEDLSKSYGNGIGNSNGIGNGNSKEAEKFFENFRQKYPGTKRGFKVEFENLKKKHKNYKEICDILLVNLERQIEERSKITGFLPEWPNLQTYINQSRWETEYKSSQSFKYKKSGIIN